MITATSQSHFLDIIITISHYYRRGWDQLVVGDMIFAFQSIWKISNALCDEYYQYISFNLHDLWSSRQYTSTCYLIINAWIDSKKSIAYPNILPIIIHQWW